MRWRALPVVLCVLGAMAVGSVAPAAAAPTRAQVEGSGSSWAANAVNQWAADLAPNGVRAVYTGNGSAQGRQDFANGITDFAVSDLAYQGADPDTGGNDSPCTDGGRCRDFAYVPLVSGGISFPYQLHVAGKLVRNLRLSPATLAGIFTGTITRWDDARIRTDNNGRTLPATPIVPVVHAEGSGVSYYFSQYLAHEFPEQWRSFAGTDRPTQFWPTPFDGRGVAQNGSDGVMNFVSSAAADGAIGYDEFSYPLARDYPVAGVQNPAGYFVRPIAYSVASALRRAVAHPDGPADLAGVWADTNPRSYPLSYFASMVIPTGATDPRMTTAKRQTLVDFTYFSACQGQNESGPIGYAPLPLDLTRSALHAVAELGAADGDVDLSKRTITTCHSPTFTAGDSPTDRIDEIAPVPAACDRAESGPCNDDGSPPVTEPQPGRAPTALAISGGRTVTAGAAARLTGSLRDTHGAVAGAAVSLQAAGPSGWRRIATVRTDARGAFRATVRPGVTTRYRASFGGDTRRLAATSGVVGVGVAYAVRAHLSAAAVKRGGVVGVSGTVAPARPGDAVVLQRLVGTHWRGVAAALTFRSGRAVAFRFRYAPTARTTVLRVLRPAGPANLAGASAALRVRTR